MNEKVEKFKPYDYQIEAAHRLIKYKKCTAEISTSAGKTLISFILFKYLFDTQSVKKILYIVPSVDLATQSIDKFQEYENFLFTHKKNWRAAVLTSKLNKAQKLALVNNMEKEFTIESLIRAKGFRDAAVTFHGGSVNVVVDCETLTDEQVAQILDIVQRETGESAENVKVIPGAQ